MAANPALPPGPRSPVVAQTARYVLDPYGLFEAGQRAFGDVFTLRVMKETWVVLAHPDAVREVFSQGPDELDSGVANRSLRPLLGTRNLLLLDGAEHLRRRKLVLPPFHGERMRAYEGKIREVTRREVAAWPIGSASPTLPRMQAITFRVVLRAVFGVEEGPRLERLAALLRRFTTWTTDPRRGLVFAFGPAASRRGDRHPVHAAGAPPARRLSGSAHVAGGPLPRQAPARGRVAAVRRRRASLHRGSFRAVRGEDRARGAASGARAETCRTSEPLDRAARDRARAVARRGGPVVATQRPRLPATLARSVASAPGRRSRSGTA